MLKEEIDKQQSCLEERLKKTQYKYFGYPKDVSVEFIEYQGELGWWVELVFGENDPFVFKKFIKYA